MLGLSACAVGDPQPASDITDVSATLNGDVHSSVVGDTEYWWKYGETTAYGSETPHGTVAISDDQPHPVSEPIGGLTPDTMYHFQLCARDEEEEPPRTVCSSDRTFSTYPPGDGSLITFTSDRGSGDQIFVMDTFGSGQTSLSDSPDGQSAWSPDATKIAFASFRDGNEEIYVMDADGSNQENLTDTEFVGEGDPAWSPDGAKIAYSSCGEYCEIWVMDADGSDQEKLTDQVGTAFHDRQPTWSPDGEQIAFYTDRESTDEVGIDEIYVMDADGANETPVTDDLNGKDDPAWSPDGTKIAFASFIIAEGSWEIVVMDADGSDQTDVSNHPASDTQPSWSPDGSRIAFTTLRDSSGDSNEVFVMDADGSNQTNLSQSDDSDDSDPAWSSAP